MIPARLSRRAAPLGAAVAIALALGLSAKAQETPRLDWQVARDTAQIQLTLSYRTEHRSSSNSHTAVLGDLPGLTDAQLASPTLQTVRFRLHRDAGDFECDGSARAERASGTCDFKPNPGFATTLRAHGIGPADPGDLFELAYVDIGTAYLDELSRQRYPAPTVEDLVRAGQHAVSLAYLRDLGADGYRADSLAGLIRIRDHGVSAKYIASLKAAGYGRLSIDDLVRVRDHGVSPQYLTSLGEAGYRDVPIETVIRMRDHGVTAGFIDRANDRAKDRGEARLTPDELVMLHDSGGLYAEARAPRPPRPPREPRD